MKNHFTIKKEIPGKHLKQSVLKTRHGEILTPVFMPVGTQGAVKGLISKELHNMGTQIILNNVYHLFLRPGKEIIKKAGSIHDFIGWDKPVLTDSGGFQILSLSPLTKINNFGVTFKSHHDGTEFTFTPENVIDFQTEIGVDIMMPLDYPVKNTCSRKKAEYASDITLDWEKRAFEHLKNKKKSGLLFGITQGSVYRDLRIKSTEKILELPVDGIAIGGLSVGESKEKMFEMVKLTREIVPKNIPLYLMGVGKPEDIIKAVELGIDMFDCVLPTRNARTGWIYSHYGKIVIKNSQYKEDFNPIDKNCECFTCKNISRAYLRHLYKSKEINYSILSTIHNLSFYLDIMAKIRQSITTNKFDLYKEDFFNKYKNR